MEYALDWREGALNAIERGQHQNPQTLLAGAL
jgi:hypothetical protein